MTKGRRDRDECVYTGLPVGPSSLREKVQMTQVLSL
jgi:hypothetical protein